MKKNNIILIATIVVIIAVIGIFLIIQHKNSVQNEYIYSNKLVSMYETIIDTIMPLDDALNEGSTFYLDVNSFVAPIERGSGSIENKYMGLSDIEKAALLDYCKKYKSDVKGYSIDDIKAHGLFNETYLSIKNGFLIYAKNIKACSENKAKMDIEKYYAGEGAIGFTYELTYENNKWNIKESEAWVS